MIAERRSPAGSDDAPSRPDRPIRVAIVEDDRRLREHLRELLGGSPDHECVLAAGSVEEALQLAPKSPPDVILLDIHLPGVRGSLAVERLRDSFTGAIVLMHTVYEEDDLIFESLSHGASGYLLKRTPPARLLAAITEALAGGAPISPEIAHKILALFRRLPPPPAYEEPNERLTPQEAKLLGLIERGYSYRKAADTLGISVNTVRTHIRSSYEKLHVHTKSEAVSKALRSGQI
jgi:DNA-binding NarL/FixJ family response regulator